MLKLQHNTDIADAQEMFLIKQSLHCQRYRFRTSDKKTKITNTHAPLFDDLHLLNLATFAEEQMKDSYGKLPPQYNVQSFISNNPAKALEYLVFVNVWYQRHKEGKHDADLVHNELREAFKYIVSTTTQSSKPGRRKNRVSAKIKSLYRTNNLHLWSFCKSVRFCLQHDRKAVHVPKGKHI
jgi:phage terminase large subunit